MDNARIFWEQHFHTLANINERRWYCQEIQDAGKTQFREKKSRGKQSDVETGGAGRRSRYSSTVLPRRLMEQKEHPSSTTSLQLGWHPITTSTLYGNCPTATVYVLGDAGRNLQGGKGWFWTQAHTSTDYDVVCRAESMRPIAHLQNKLNIFNRLE